MLSYTRRRTLVSLGLLVLVGVALVVQGGIAGGTLRILTSSVGLSVLSASQATSLQPIAHSQPTTATIPVTATTASMRLTRLDSTLRSQYNSDYEWQVWSYSSCSGMAMAMVMNAYGQHLNAGSVLEVEQQLGVWDVQLGLLREDGIALTASYFGFNASLSHALTLQNIVDLANRGQPVIVGIRDNYYFPNGHILVVRGGDEQNIYLADSSPHDFQRMPRSMFAGMWQGFSAVLTPH